MAGAKEFLVNQINDIVDNIKIMVLGQSQSSIDQLGKLQEIVGKSDIQITKITDLVAKSTSQITKLTELGGKSDTQITKLIEMINTIDKTIPKYAIVSNVVKTSKNYSLQNVGNDKITYIPYINGSIKLKVTGCGTHGTSAEGVVIISVNGVIVANLGADVRYPKYGSTPVMKFIELVVKEGDIVTLGGSGKTNNDVQVTKVEVCYNLIEKPEGAL